MVGSALLWGTLAGLIHFMVMGALYGNPVVDGMYTRAMAECPGVRHWDSKPRYLATQFFGTQVEVYLIALGYYWLRPKLGTDGATAVATLGLFFAALRVYPRGWNMWIQSTYPGGLLRVEAIIGTVGTFVVVIAVHLLHPA